jgi:hypothetical protein
MNLEHLAEAIADALMREPAYVTSPDDVRVRLDGLVDTRRLAQFVADAMPESVLEGE